jgi:hypothetical protein
MLASLRGHSPNKQQEQRQCTAGEKGKAKEREYTSPKTRGTADDEMIGSCVSAEGLAKVASLSSATIEAAKPRVAGGIVTSSTSPLEVSSVCKGSV